MRFKEGYHLYALITIGCWLLSYVLTAVGFIHGAMNTDNVTFSRETIDHDPYKYILWNVIFK
ncbi:MAG: protein adenylyltransferase SelO family protein [Acetobacterium sp.]|nr:protein adenylyltransferase SelO family protein [Acetobacterium sp.]